MTVSFLDFQFTLTLGIRKLFRMLRWSLGLLLAFFVSPSQANPSSLEETFNAGLMAYQQKDYSTARTEFQKALEIAPHNPSVLYNLALTHFQLGENALALAFWRKALAIDPGFRLARKGREYLESRTPMRPFERDPWGFRRWLESVSLYEILWFLAGVILISGLFWIRYFAQRRVALEDQLSLPPFPTAASFFAVLVVAALFMTGWKVRESFRVRGTIIVDKASLRSLPSDQGVQLFEISGGNEVLVHRERDGWLQVQSSQGATGWLREGEILITSGAIQ